VLSQDYRLGSGLRIKLLGMFWSYTFKRSFRGS